MKMIESNLLNDKYTPKGTLVFNHLKSVSNPNSAHAIYPYRGKISAIDARQILSQLIPGSLLLDPFCGSGTILHEAQHFGIRAYRVLWSERRNCCQKDRMMLELSWTLYGALFAVACEGIVPLYIMFSAKHHKSWKNQLISDNVHISHCWKFSPSPVNIDYTV